MKNNSEPLIGQGLTRTYNHFGNIVSEKPETKKVCFDLRTLKRFLHRKSEYVKFLNSYEDEETEDCLYWDENKVNILVDNKSICVTIDLDENYADISLEGCGNVYRFSLQFNTEYMSNRKSTFFKTNTKFQPTSVTLVLQRDDKGKLYFQCDNEKIENLKVWLDDPDEYVLENMFNKDDSKDFVLDDSNILALDEKECVKFSLQNVTQNIKQLDSSFNKENNDEFTIYYFVETKDSNGKYEFDSCETISLSKDKIGDKDAMLGYISVHNGNPVTTKKIKMFIARGDCKKFDFEKKNLTSDKQMNLLKKNGFIELDVKRRTNEKTNKYCVVYGESRVDKTEITQFDCTHMCSNVYSNKINDINEHKNSSRIGRKSKQSETPTPDGDYESESKEVFYYTDENSEREKQAIKNYLDNGVDSQICYINPNSTGTIKIKNTVNKMNYIDEHKIKSEIEKEKEKEPEQSETLTSYGDYESEYNEVSCYTGTDVDTEREKQAIKNYLDNGVDSQICYINPNSTGTIKIKNTVGNNLEKKDCIIINVSELCNSWVWRYKNNDKNLWFFQIWLAKFAFFFNIGNVAKILKWKEQYKNDDTQQIKSSLSNNDNENNKIKNENENGKENENMAAPPGYNDENNPLESNL